MTTTTPSTAPLTEPQARVERIRVDLISAINNTATFHVAGQRQRVEDAIHNALDLLKHHL